jgi:tellurite resistance protein TerC
MIWAIFIGVVIVFLAIDLGIFNRTPHVISTKEATVWTTIWVTTALSFSGVIYWLYNNNLVENVNQLSAVDATIKYITGYLIELSLSLDNIFVIAVIFSSFNVPQKYQHRVLFWGILGAIVFRALMILFGVTLINSISWSIYLFGGFLILTAIKMMFSDDEDHFDPDQSLIFRMIRKVIPVTSDLKEERFFINRLNVRAVTPLFVVLIIIEATDVLFALDSIPAILAITSDPFLVFSSNILAILGLRSMYFFLANMIEQFKMLTYSLIAILLFVGTKMVLSHVVHFPEWVSLSFIGLSLGIGILLSLAQGKKEKSPSN